MGYLLGHKVRHTVISGSHPVVIIGTTAHLTPYITSLVADSAATDPAIETSTVKSHTYRRYPGGPAITRKTHNRSYDPARASSLGITLPGKNAYIEEWTSSTNEKVIKVVTFTFTGSFYLLRGFIKAHVASGKHFYLRSPGGRPFKMAAA